MLTAAERLRVRMYLGFPRNYESHELTAAMSAVDADSDLETLVKSQLSQLSEVDLKLASARDTAGLTQVNKINFARGQIIRDLHRLGSETVRRLSDILGVQLVRDPYVVQMAAPLALG